MTGSRTSADEAASESPAPAWDPTGTISGALWIGGGQWAGKSTVARLLALNHGLTAYHHDFPASRAHRDRAVAARVRQGQPPGEPTEEETWVARPPEQMAAEVIAQFRDRFDWALDDLRALVTARPVIAEGWGLRPELVAPLLDSPARMVVLVPTDEFRRYQLSVLPRAREFRHDVSAPEAGQRHRLERDRLVAADAARSARRLGLRVIEVDGTADADALARIVAAHFRAYLPAAVRPPVRAAQIAAPPTPTRPRPDSEKTPRARPGHSGASSPDAGRGLSDPPRRVQT
jgi:hypothetical protein